MFFSQGYYRKAEVEFHTFRFSEAIQSYRKALELQPDDPSIIDAMNRASRSLIQDKRGIVLFSMNFFFYFLF